MGHRPIQREDNRFFINGRMHIIKDGRIPSVGNAGWYNLSGVKGRLSGVESMLCLPKIKKKTT